MRLLLLCGLGLTLQAASIQLERDAARKDVFVLRGVAASAAAEGFSVRVDAAGDVPALSGSYERTSEGIRFRPKYPLQGGMKYKATWQVPGAPLLEARFTVTKVEVTSTARVERIYPSAGVLPSNQLKLYIHFSAPMSRGEAWRRIHLVEDGGKEVMLPFLEIEEELWDPSQTRLTVLFDPGRIKRGLVPHNEAGPALLEGRTYHLVVDRAWPDGKGAALTREFRKTFQVRTADRTPPTLGGWKIHPPAAGTRVPLRVDVPEPMDAALLQRLLWVIDGEGKTLAGDVALQADETRWVFTPDAPWRAGVHQLRAGMTLEDLAGNRIDRKFDVDSFEKVEMRLTVKTRDVPFTIPAATATPR